MDLLDTMLIIEYCNKNELPHCAICEVSIFEMLKNKDEETMRKELEKIKRNVISSKSEIYTSKEYRNFLTDNNSLEEDFNIAKELIENVSFYLSKHLNFICQVIAELIILTKLDDAKIMITEEEKAIIYNIFSAFRMMDNIVLNQKEQWIEVISHSEAKIINSEFFVEIINMYIQCFKSKIKNEKLEINQIIAINQNDICGANKMCFKKKYIDKFFDEIIVSKDNNEISKKIYKIYIENLLIHSGNMTFNDLVDIEIFFCGFTNKLDIKSKDKKLQRLLILNSTFCDEKD